DALDDDPVLVDHIAPDSSLLTLVAARDDQHRIATTNLSHSSFAPASTPARLQDFGRQGDDTHELLLSQLPPDRAEDTCPPRRSLCVDQDGGVVVEFDVA